MGVLLRPGAGHEQGEGGDQGGRDEGARPRQGEQRERDGRHHGPDDGDQTGVAEVSEPAGMAGSDHVEGHESETHHADRFARHPQPAAGEDPRTAEGDGRQDEKHDRSATHPSQLQATARKVTAATSRQSAPSVSRIFGTDAPRSRGASRAVGRNAAPP